MQFKVISLNIAGFKEWDSRRQKIAQRIDRENPDVVLLQEVKFDPLVSAYSQSVELNKLLNRPFEFTQTSISKYYQSSSGSSYREGLAVLSRFPITNSEILVLTKQVDDKHTRIVQNIDLDVRGRELLLSNVHFSNNAYSVDQLQELIHILDSRGEKRLIAGDFNIFDVEANRPLYDSGYTSSVAFKTYVSFPSEGHTLDYVLIPAECSFASLETIEGLSDHNMLVCTVEIT